MYLSLYISGSCMSTLRHKYKRKRCLLKRWWWCGCKLFLEKFLKSWTTFLLRFLFLFYLCARMPAQVHRLENMYWLHQCCIITCVIVCMREKENREDERESIHLDISLLLYLFCCTLCCMLPSHIFQNSLITASGVIENALIKYKMVTNTES